MIYINGLNNVLKEFMKKNNLIILAVIIILIFIMPSCKRQQNKSSQSVATSLKSPNAVKPQNLKPQNLPNLVLQQPQPLRTYRESLELSKNQNKNVLLFFTADWCTWCKKMKSETFSKPTLRQFLLSNYVCCLVDVDKEKFIANKYQIVGIPAYVIITPNEQIIKTNEGFKEEAIFLNWLRRK
jgi:thiol:disulfide interchange protein